MTSYNKKKKTKKKPNNNNNKKKTPNKKKWKKKISLCGHNRIFRNQDIHMPQTFHLYYKVISKKNIKSI